jgi:hypothetical protein
MIKKPLISLSENLLIGCLTELLKKSLKGFMTIHTLKAPYLSNNLVLTGNFGVLKTVCSTPHTGQ